MSQGQQSPPVLTADRLQEIRDADAACGENLQFCPATWAQRRELLLHIDTLHEATAHLTAELSAMLEPYSGGTRSLVDLVDRMKYAQQITAEIRKESAHRGIADQLGETGI